MRNPLQKNSERGSAVIELSLAMPLMIVLCFGAIEFGRAFVIREGRVSAAMEAARVGSQSSCPRPTSAEVMAAAQTSLASAGISASQTTIGLTNPGGASGTDVVVDVSYQLVFPVLSKFLSIPPITTMSVQVAAENE